MSNIRPGTQCAKIYRASKYSMSAVICSIVAKEGTYIKIPSGEWNFLFHQPPYLASIRAIVLEVIFFPLVFTLLKDYGDRTRSVADEL
jgi:hypothetical protein